MTIEAVDYEACQNNEIDTISTRVSFPSSTNQQTVQEVGRNSIGFFDFTYQIQNITNVNATEYTTEDSPSPSIVALIVTVIFLVLLTVVLLTIGISLLWTIRNMSLKLKELQQQSPCHQRSK